MPTIVHALLLGGPHREFAAWDPHHAFRRRTGGPNSVFEGRAGFTGV
jgi:hypothetical protein